MGDVVNRFEGPLVRKAGVKMQSVHHLPVVLGELPRVTTAQVPLLCGDPEASGDTGQESVHRKVPGVTFCSLHHV